MLCRQRTTKVRCSTQKLDSGRVPQIFAAEWRARSGHRICVLDDDSAVYDDTLDAEGGLLGLVVGGAVGDGGGIEDDEVGEGTLADDAAIGKAKAGGGF